MYECFPCMHILHHVQCRCPQRTEKDIESLQNGVTGSTEVPHWCLEQNPGSVCDFNCRIILPAPIYPHFLNAPLMLYLFLFPMSWSLLLFTS